jgi:predicted Rossmann-fold nucleotide-binding protein
VNGFYDHMLKWMENAVREGFVSQSRIESIIVEEKMELLIQKLLA